MSNQPPPYDFTSPLLPYMQAENMPPDQQGYPSNQTPYPTFDPMFCPPIGVPSNNTSLGYQQQQQQPLGGLVPGQGGSIVEKQQQQSINQQYQSFSSPQNVSAYRDDRMERPTPPPPVQRSHDQQPRPQQFPPHQPPQQHQPQNPQQYQQHTHDQQQPQRHQQSQQPDQQSNGKNSNVKYYVRVNGPNGTELKEVSTEEYQNILHGKSNPQTSAPTSESHTSKVEEKKMSEVDQQKKLDQMSNENPSIEKIRDNYESIPQFKGIEKPLVEQILTQVVETMETPTRWEDIAGLADAKMILYETIVLPALRPDIFIGLRSPAKGILLFGPPGNGKTLLAKAVSSQCKATFFTISASSIESKWVGEGEKLVKAMFAVANYLAPSVVFIDEIDSILTTRSSEENESSRRMKTEFLVQLDGVTANLNAKNRILVMGATNRPFDLDDAILRRFMKRIYIPMPDPEARKALVKNAMEQQFTSLGDEDYSQIAEATSGFSGSDIKNLCKEAAMVAIRELGNERLLAITPDQVRPVSTNDFMVSVRRVRPSVSLQNIEELEEWNDTFGTCANVK